MQRRVHILRLSVRQYRMLLLENGLRRLREARLLQGAAAPAPATPRPRPGKRARHQNNPPAAVTYDVPGPGGVRKRCALVYVEGHGFVGAQHIAYQPGDGRGLGRVEMRVFVKCERLLPGPEAERRVRAARVWDMVEVGDDETARAVTGAERAVRRALDADCNARALDRAARADAGVL